MDIETLSRYIDGVLPALGVNKKREILRLIYEIVKRDGKGPEEVLPPAKNLHFECAKKMLLQKRYPHAFSNAPKNAFYLPKLEINPALCADLTPRDFYPRKIYIENCISGTALAARARRMFPKASFYEWDGKEMVGSTRFSQRTETLVIHREKYDFLKPCPCSQGNAGCGYNLINLGFGCRFECEYCFLQQYQNLHAVLLPANVQDFLDKIDEAKFTQGLFDRPRIGSGEFTDSLVFDDLTQYSRDLVPFFRARPHLQFEFKTKSVCIEGLLQAGGAENVVVSWSVNAPRFIERVEHFTPSLSQRLEAAVRTAKAGYRLGFHFDPVVPFAGWREAYAQAAEQIAEAVPADKVAWISVGLLRFSRELKKNIENRFPNNTILDGEFLLDFDGKMRYPESLRKEVYAYFVPLLQKLFPKTVVYVCMEKANICPYSIGK